MHLPVLSAMLAVFAEISDCIVVKLESPFKSGRYGYLDVDVHRTRTVGSPVCLTRCTPFPLRLGPLGIGNICTLGFILSLGLRD